MKIVFATSLIVFSLIGTSFGLTPIYYSENECNIDKDLQKYQEILQDDVVVKTFMLKYPDAVSYPAGGIDDSDPPQTSVHYEYNLGDSKAKLTLRIFEHLEDPNDCFKPFSYVLNYQDGEKTIQIINYEEKTQEILDFLNSDQNEISATKYFLDPSYTIYSLKHKQYEYFIPYKITNSNVEQMDLRCETSSLLVHLQNSSDGNIVINIPTKMLSSKQGSENSDFIILANNEEVDFEETESNSESRTLDISFIQNTDVIEIVATQWAANAPEYTPTCATVESGESQYYRVLSPRQQMKMGVPLYEIKCKEGFYPTFKIDRITPACVTENTLDKLLIRGWSPLRLGMPAETNILITYGAIRVFPNAVTQKLDPRAPILNTIYWVNNDVVPHTITAEDKSWSTGVIESGKIGSASFEKLGTYKYFVKENPKAKGVIEFSGLVDIDE